MLKIIYTINLRKILTNFYRVLPQYFDYDIIIT